VTIARPARPSIRRGDAREFEVQRRRSQRGFDRADLRRRLLRERLAAIALFLRHRVLAAQPLGSTELAVGALHRGARAIELGLQPIDFGLERSRVDLEEQVAAVDDRPSEKRTAETNPETRGRISTESTACRRPVNSSHSVTSRSITGATVTWGSGDGACWAAVPVHAARATVHAIDVRSNAARTPRR
jgi:hypothetical protein